MNASRWAESPVKPTTAAPNAYNPDTSTYPGDEFSQTGPGDDLFDDDFTPIAEPIVESAPPREARPFAPRGRGRGRGRGERRGGGLHAARASAMPSAPQSVAVPSTADPRPATTAVQESTTTTQAEDLPTNAPTSANVGSTQSELPTTSTATGNASNTTTQAVRGDRSGTGGVKKAKLTEEELSARMEAIKLKNASLEAAHARAEADEASFQAREAEAQARRRVERQNRQQMMGERERNRLRKLGALQGREWDANKDADERALDSRKGQAQSRRGLYGGISGGSMASAPGVTSTADEHSQMEDSSLDQRYEDRSGGRGRGGPRGRGNRGDFGPSRGRGRGGRERDAGGVDSSPRQAPSAPSQNDFPALQAPTSSSAQGSGSEAVKSPLSLVDNPGSAPMLKTVLPQMKKSWAEEMETPVTPTNKA